MLCYTRRYTSGTGVRSGTNIVSHGYGCAIVQSIARKFIPALRCASDEEIIEAEKDNRNGDFVICMDDKDGIDNLAVIAETNSSDVKTTDSVPSSSRRHSSEMCSLKSSSYEDVTLSNITHEERAHQILNRLDIIDLCRCRYIMIICVIFNIFFYVIIWVDIMLLVLHVYWIMFNCLSNIIDKSFCT